MHPGSHPATTEANSAISRSYGFVHKSADPFLPGIHTKIRLYRICSRIWGPDFLQESGSQLSDLLTLGPKSPVKVFIRHFLDHFRRIRILVRQGTANSKAFGALWRQ